MNNKKSSINGTKVLLTIMFIFMVYGIIISIFEILIDMPLFNPTKNTVRILSSYENKDYEEDLKKYAKENDFKVEFSYMGDLSIVDELNFNSKDYDAVWISNSVWLYMLNNSYLTSNSKSISISPVVMGIKNKKAKELGLIGKDITNDDILKLVTQKKIKYVMSSVTQTNTGATAYLGFLNALANSPEVLTKEMLDNESLTKDLINLFSGVERVSGDEDYLEEMFIKGTEYEAIIASESSLININSKLKDDDKLYLLYPVDGVPINDSTFAFIDNKEDKEEKFLTLQKYLLSKDGQEKLQSRGRRTWFGGVNNNVDKKVFNPAYGIDTTKYLITSKYPSKEVITKAINLYIEELRKPTHVVFCLDYSGSMFGEGESELKEAMNYILSYEEASKDKLQFSKKDKITIVTFSSKVDEVETTNTGLDTRALLDTINNKNPGGSTALYDAIYRGLEELAGTSDDYTKTIIAMTDGEANVGNINLIESRYRNNYGIKVPVYSIMFGSSSEYQLNEIASLTNGKVFDGKTNLLGAFKEVRGYN